VSACCRVGEAGTGMDRNSYLTPRERYPPVPWATSILLNSRCVTKQFSFLSPRESDYGRVICFWRVRISDRMFWSAVMATCQCLRNLCAFYSRHREIPFGPHSYARSFCSARGDSRGLRADSRACFWAPLRASGPPPSSHHPERLYVLLWFSRPVGALFRRGGCPL